jgi:hypothetical protein
VFVHSDPFRAASLVPKTKDRAAFVDSHIGLLSSAASDRPLWMPGFNYDFPKTNPSISRMTKLSSDQFRSVSEYRWRNGDADSNLFRLRYRRPSGR